jgi:anti-anti-sigma regulatory factor
MVSGDRNIWEHERDLLSYADVCRLAADMERQHGTVLVVRCVGTAATSTAALARLCLLRRKLLREGRELFIDGLQGRARSLYEICRLQRLLPQCEKDTTGGES